MTVDPASTCHHAAHGGETDHFCSACCRTKFLADPQRYIGSSVSSVRVAEGTIWTCPMHPEIWQDHPGACPICGMTLEPATVSAESGPSNELVDMTRRFWLGPILAPPVFILERGGDRKSIRLNYSHQCAPRMPSSACTTNILYH